MENETDLSRVIANLGGAFEEFRTKYERRLDDIEVRSKRPQFGPIESGYTDSERKEFAGALRSYLKSGSDAEFKAMSVGSDPDGGYTVPNFLASSITTRLYETSPMRQLARVITLGGGDTFEEVADNDEADAEWVGETDERTDTDNPKVGKLLVPVHEIFAMPKVTQKLIDDSAIDIGAWLESKISDRIGRKENAAYVSGNGVAKPLGFMSYPMATTDDNTRPWGTIQYFPTGVDGDWAATAKADVLIDLCYSLKAPYRDGAAWLMSRTAARAIRKLKDGQSNYLWQPAATAGEPDRLLGYPVRFAEDIPAIGSNSFSIWFGNWKLAYTIVDRLGMRMLRDPFTSKPYVKFYAYKRTGGGVNNSEALKAIKFSVS